MSETTKIKLLAGIPDDDNREYLPERLKESEIVVNENGNNSQVYPANLKEMKACLIDDEEDTWYEYVPDSYDPSRKTPLVFSMHGGIMTGWHSASILHGRLWRTERDLLWFTQMRTGADSGRLSVKEDYLKSCPRRMRKGSICMIFRMTSAKIMMSGWSLSCWRS